MYRYETHLHTTPVSRCAVASVRDSLEFYKDIGYDGVFITNHFLDGNINITGPMSYEDKINFYFSAYEEGVKIGQEIGLKVFLGVELSSDVGADFLVYGLDKEWYLAHPEIMDMKKTDELSFMIESGALVIQAHPYREASYIDHINLYPCHVHGVEVVNACRTEFENKMAKLYAENYELIEFAGSDNHQGKKQTALAGVSSDKPISDVQDFVECVKKGKMNVFTLMLPERG